MSAGRARRRRWWPLPVAAAVVAAAVAAGAWWWLAGREVPGGPPGRDQPAAATPHRNQALPTAQLRLSTSPAGAAIVLDGEPTGRLAPDLFAVEARVAHTLRLELEGHEPVELDLRLEPGEVREIVVEMVRLRAPSPGS